MKYRIAEYKDHFEVEKLVTKTKYIFIKTLRILNIYCIFRYELERKV